MRIAQPRDSSHWIGRPFGRRPPPRPTFLAGCGVFATPPGARAGPARHRLAGGYSSLAWLAQSAVVATTTLRLPDLHFCGLSGLRGLHTVIFSGGSGIEGDDEF